MIRYGNNHFPIKIREVRWVCNKRYKEKPIKKMLLCCAYSSEEGSKVQ